MFSIASNLRATCHYFVVRLGADFDRQLVAIVGVGVAENRPFVRRAALFLKPIPRFLHACRSMLMLDDYFTSAEYQRMPTRTYTCMALIAFPFFFSFLLQHHKNLREGK